MECSISPYVQPMLPEWCEWMIYNYISNGYTLAMPNITFFYISYATSYYKKHDLKWCHLVASLCGHQIIHYFSCITTTIFFHFRHHIIWTSIVNSYKADMLMMQILTQELQFSFSDWRNSFWKFWLPETNSGKRIHFPSVAATLLFI